MEREANRWRRRESNYEVVLKLRKLLILQYGRKARNARNAEVRYTAGTQETKARRRLGGRKLMEFSAGNCAIDGSKESKSTGTARWLS